MPYVSWENEKKQKLRKKKKAEKYQPTKNN